MPWTSRRTTHLELSGAFAQHQDFTREVCGEEGCGEPTNERGYYCDPCDRLEPGSAAALAWAAAMPYAATATPATEASGWTAASRADWAEAARTGGDWREMSAAELGAGGGCSGCGYSIHDCHCGGKQGALL